MTNVIQRKRVELDASGQTLGRVATQIAVLLRGKHKTTYVPHIDAGDFVHIVHLRGIRFTGQKLDRETHYSHTGHPGGLRAERYRHRWERDPERMLRDAVRRMLPPTRLRDGMLKRLTVSL